MENKQSSKQVLEPCKGMNRLCINNKIGGHTNYKLNNLFMYTVYLKIKFKSHPMLTDYVQHYFTLYEMNNKYFQTSKTGNISSLLVFKSVYLKDDDNLLEFSVVRLRNVILLSYQVWVALSR